MERYDVLIQCGFYEDGEHIDPARKTSETSKINALVKNLRDKTLLDTENLVNNSGNLTLVGEKVEEAK
jgi:hypothetical protein